MEDFFYYGGVGVRVVLEKIFYDMIEFVICFRCKGYCLCFGVVCGFDIVWENGVGVNK